MDAKLYQDAIHDHPCAVDKEVEIAHNVLIFAFGTHVCSVALSPRLQKKSAVNSSSFSRNSASSSGPERTGQ